MKNQYNKIINSTHMGHERKSSIQEVVDLQEDDFRSPKRLMNAMDLAFPFSRTGKNKWMIQLEHQEKWYTNPLSKTYEDVLVERDFDSELDRRDLQRISLTGPNTPEDLAVVEINFNWFYKRNLMKELNWFQIWVGKLVRIL